MNAGWMVAGNALYVASQWAVLAVLAKLCSAHEVGEFALGLTVTAPVFMFTNLQLRAVQATDANREYLFSHYLGLRIITAILSLVVIVGIALAAGYAHAAACAVVCMGLAKAVESIGDVGHGLFQQRERFDWIAQSMTLKGATGFVAVLIAVSATGSVCWAILALAGAWAGTVVLYDLPRVARAVGPSDAAAWFPAGIRPRFTWATLARLTWLAVPLGFFTMLSSLHANIPRYFIEHQLGTASLGVFVAISSLFTGIYFVQAALGHATLPRLAFYHSRGMLRDYLRVAGIVLGFSLINSLGAVAVASFGGGRLLQFLYCEEFYPYDRLFLWLAVASVAQCLSGAVAFLLQASRQFAETAWGSLGCAVTILLASMWLIPRFGIEGAAYALLLGSVVSGVVYAVRFVVLLCSFQEYFHATRSSLPAGHEAGSVPRRPRLATASHR